MGECNIFQNLWSPPVYKTCESCTVEVVAYADIMFWESGSHEMLFKIFWMSVSGVFVYFMYRNGAFLGHETLRLVHTYDASTSIRKSMCEPGQCKRKKENVSFSCALLASPRFTCTFSYACIIRVNQPLSWTHLFLHSFHVFHSCKLCTVLVRLQ